MEISDIGWEQIKKPKVRQKGMIRCVKLMWELDFVF